jgi:hypothetical protein
MANSHLADIILGQNSYNPVICSTDIWPMHYWADITKTLSFGQKILADKIFDG